jgi:hypothetical protein
MEAGESPEHQRSILEQLEQPIKPQAQTKDEQGHRKQNPIAQ